MSWRTVAKRGLRAGLRAGRPAWAAWARPGYYSRPVDWTAPPTRVLIVSCDWLGDNLWARQVLPALRARWPHARLEVVTRAVAAPLWPDADAVHVEPAIVSDRDREPVDWAALRTAARAHRRRDPDLVIDLTGNRYSAAFSFLTRPRRALGFDGDELGGLYAVRVDADDPAEHAARRPWRVVAPALGSQAPAAPPDPTFDPAWIAPGRPLPDGPLAVLGPGAGWAGKRWPVARYRALAAELEQAGWTVCATGAPAEAKLARAALADTTHGVLACWPLAETLPLLAAAGCVVCNDSALGHIAAALGRRVVALYGPTNPARYRPLGPAVTVLRHGCARRPEGLAHHCHGRPRHPCPPTCWADLSVATVREAVGGP